MVERSKKRKHWQKYMSRAFSRKRELVLGTRETLVKLRKIGRKIEEERVSTLVRTATKGLY